MSPQLRFKTAKTQAIQNEYSNLISKLKTPSFSYTSQIKNLSSTQNLYNPYNPHLWVQFFLICGKTVHSATYFCYKFKKCRTRTTSARKLLRRASLQLCFRLQDTGENRIRRTCPTHARKKLQKFHFSAVNFGQIPKSPCLIGTGLRFLDAWVL